MRVLADLVIRSLIIVVAASCIGLGLNIASSKPLPWFYRAPKELTIEGIEVQLVDEKQAKKLGVLLPAHIRPHQNDLTKRG